MRTFASQCRRTATATELQRAALGLIEHTSALHSRREIAEALFEHLEPLVGFDMGTVLRLTGFAAQHSHGKSKKQVALWNERSSHYTGTMTRLASAARTQGHVVLDHDALPPRDRDRAPAYVEYLRPYRLRSNLGLFVFDGDGYSDMFAIGRAGTGGSPFSDGDLTTIRHLYPAIAISLRSCPPDRDGH